MMKLFIRKVFLFLLLCSDTQAGLFKQLKIITGIATISTLIGNGSSDLVELPNTRWISCSDPKLTDITHLGCTDTRINRARDNCLTGLHAELCGDNEFMGFIDLARKNMSRETGCLGYQNVALVKNTTRAFNEATDNYMPIRDSFEIICSFYQHNDWYIQCNLVTKVLEPTLFNTTDLSECSAIDPFKSAAGLLTMRDPYSAKHTGHLRLDTETNEIQSYYSFVRDFSYTATHPATITPDYTKTPTDIHITPTQLISPTNTIPVRPVTPTMQVITPTKEHTETKERSKSITPIPPEPPAVPLPGEVVLYPPWALNLIQDIIMECINHVEEQAKLDCVNALIVPPSDMFCADDSKDYVVPCNTTGISHAEFQNNNNMSLWNRTCFDTSNYLSSQFNKMAMFNQHRVWIMEKAMVELGLFNATEFLQKYKVVTDYEGHVRGPLKENPGAYYQ